MSNDDDLDEFFSKVGTSKEAKAKANPAVQKLDRLIKIALAEGREVDAEWLNIDRRRLLKKLLGVKEPEPKIDILGDDAPF